MYAFSSGRDTFTNFRSYSLANSLSVFFKDLLLWTSSEYPTPSGMLFSPYLPGRKPEEVRNISINLMELLEMSKPTAGMEINLGGGKCLQINFSQLFCLDISYYEKFLP